MTNTVARMTPEELRDMIESVVETDEGLPVRKSLRPWLLRQRREEPLENVANHSRP